MSSRMGDFLLTLAIIIFFIVIPVVVAFGIFAP